MALSIVFIGAHPDDETILVGGTLGMLAENGHRVSIVCATQGEGGEVGEPPVTDDRSRLGAIRTEELRCAVMALGADNLTLLGYIDPTVGEGEELYPFESDFDTLVDQLQGLIEEFEADIVLTHGSDGEYGHPAHQLIHQATLKAVQKSDTSPVMYSVFATVPDIDDRLYNKSDAAHLVLNVEPWLPIKLRAAGCHVSQHALFKRRKKLTHIRDAMRLIESFHKHWPSDSLEDDFATQILAVGGYRP